MSIDILEHPAILQILVYLYDKDKVNRKELKENITRSMKTIYKALDVLRELGLIKEMERLGEHGEIGKEHLTWLTVKGQFIAKRFVEAEQKLQEE